MSAEYLKQVRDRFVTAYSRLLADTRGSWLKKPSGEAHLHTMKVEFDAALALVSDTTAETEWVRSVLAEHGYSGPLTETSCPLREWLAPKETQPVPATFTEFVIDTDERGRFVYFSLKEATNRMAEFATNGENFEFSTETHKFAEAWEFAWECTRDGNSMGPATRHAFKLGIAAGMKPDL
jgi:hypothetical protein